jgi:hypothetical protein
MIVWHAMLINRINTWPGNKLTMMELVSKFLVRPKSFLVLPNVPVRNEDKNGKVKITGKKSKSRSRKKSSVCWTYLSVPIVRRSSFNLLVLGNTFSFFDTSTL